MSSRLITTAIEADNKDRHSGLPSSMDAQQSGIS
jgi:hypothetical protein